MHAMKGGTEMHRAGTEAQEETKEMIEIEIGIERKNRRAIGSAMRYVSYNLIDTPLLICNQREILTIRNSFN